MKSDIEIAQATTPYPIHEIASALGIPESEIEPYGRTKAKVSLKYIDSLAERPKGKLILVTAISPTPAGEGKTTTTVGLGGCFKSHWKTSCHLLERAILGPCIWHEGWSSWGRPFPSHTDGGHQSALYG